MCRFEQNISNDVKRTTKFYVKSKLLSIYIYIENLYTKKFKSHFSIWHILNVREHCKLPNAKIQVKCFHCQMFPLSNVSIVKCFHCERSIQGLCLLVKHDEAKDVQSKDIVIDPLFPAGSLVPDNVQTNPSP